MTSSRRFAAYVLSFSVGFGVPLMALAAAHDGTDFAEFEYHTSSRQVAQATTATPDEMQELRARLWALTEAGSAQCNLDGVMVPCASIGDAN